MTKKKKGKKKKKEVCPSSNWGRKRRRRTKKKKTTTTTEQRRHRCLSLAAKHEAKQSQSYSLKMNSPRNSNSVADMQAHNPSLHRKKKKENKMLHSRSYTCNLPIFSPLFCVVSASGFSLFTCASACGAGGSPHSSAQSATAAQPSASARGCSSRGGRCDERCTP